jgi:hypothetical protein
LSREPGSGDFQPPPPQILAERFSHPRAEYPVKVKRRKVRNLREFDEFERSIQGAVNVAEHSVHSLGIFVAAALRCHGPLVLFEIARWVSALAARRRSDYNCSVEKDHDRHLVSPISSLGKLRIAFVANPRQAIGATASAV